MRRLSKHVQARNVAWIFLACEARRIHAEFNRIGNYGKSIKRSNFGAYPGRLLRGAGCRPLCSVGGSMDFWISNSQTNGSLHKAADDADRRHFNYRSSGLVVSSSTQAFEVP